MKELAIHLLTKNNEETIKDTLDSILSLRCDIIIGDLGSTDQTLNLCSNYHAKIFKINLNNDYSQAWNKLLEMTDCKWIMTINPWERIFKGIEHIKGLKDGSYKFNVVKGDTITKQVRLWHRNKNIKYTNPVYEQVLDPNAQELPVYLSSANFLKSDYPLLIENWKKNKPLAKEPHYYEACNLLLQKRWQEFLSVAEHYLFIENKVTMSLVMTWYYCSMVYCYIKKDYNKAINYIIKCIENKPIMAEFWCLLGDIFYDLKQLNKAKEFYENAILIGSKRKSDDWPFEVSKYREYPSKMIENCKTVNSLRTYLGESRQVFS